LIGTTNVIRYRRRVCMHEREKKDREKRGTNNNNGVRTKKKKRILAIFMRFVGGSVVMAMLFMRLCSELRCKETRQNGYWLEHEGGNMSFEV